jgi:hypothetical protein
MSKILIKKSTVPGKVPIDQDLDVGELAVNTADAVLYTKHNDNIIKRITATPIVHEHHADDMNDGVLNIDRIPNLDASKVISGVFDIARIPPAALERLHIVADQTARFALTTANVQNGDTVKQADTNTMYFVIDDTNLDSETGYEIYTASAAVTYGTTAGTACEGNDSRLDADRTRKTTIDVNEPSGGSSGDIWMQF